MGDKGTRKYARQVKRQASGIRPNLAESKVEHAAYVYACRLVYLSLSLWSIETITGRKSKGVGVHTCPLSCLELRQPP